MVHYWGQNSYGGSHPNDRDLWEKDLEFYCDKDDLDVINLSFLNVFNAGSGKLPEINFSNHCDDFFNGTSLRTCPKIGKDITYCQRKGKTVLLSLGGAIANTGFPSSAAASDFANTLWDLFMEGKHNIRPFGDAVVDGIDLDLEGGSQQYYDSFLNHMQLKFKQSSRRYYVTAAPQCEFPDRNLQTIMEQGHIDAIFIQFYNNWCGVHNYGNQWAWNWPQWDTWAKTKSYNKDVKLLIGAPASSTAAGTGYISYDNLERIIGDIRPKYASFGGIMLWDSSQNQHNLVNNSTYSKHIKQFLIQGGGCSPKPPTPTPTTTPTTTTTNPTSTPTATSTTTSTATQPTSTTTQTSISTSTTSVSTTNQPTFTQPIPTSTSTSTQPTPTYPLPNEPCITGSLCVGTKFATCNHGRWLFRDCPHNLKCMSVGETLYCG